MGRCTARAGVAVYALDTNTVFACFKSKDGGGWTEERLPGPRGGSRRPGLSSARPVQWGGMRSEATKAEVDRLRVAGLTPR